MTDLSIRPGRLILQEMVDAFKADPELELEMRLEMKSNLEPRGLPEDVLLAMYNKLLTSSQRGIFEFSQSILHDKFYNDSVRCRFGIGAVEIVRKTPVSKLIALCPQRAHSFHFTLKREEPLKIPVEELPEDGVQLVRIQREWKFVYKNRFAYMLRKVKSGPTVELASVSRDFRFDLELEILRNPAYLASQDSSQIVNAFIEKTLDLVGRYKNGILEKIVMTFPHEGPALKKGQRKKKASYDASQMVETDVLVNNTDIIVNPVATMVKVRQEKKTMPTKTKKSARNHEEEEDNTPVIASLPCQPKIKKQKPQKLDLQNPPKKKSHKKEKVGKKVQQQKEEEEEEEEEEHQSEEHQSEEHNDKLEIQESDGE